MALTQVDSGLIESGAALENIGAGNITPAYLNTQAQYTGFKNRIINGAMQIDQRNAGASVTLTNSGFNYTVDRWAAATTLASSSTVTAQRVASGISSFPSALRILRGSGTYTGSSILIQEVETLNCQDLAGHTVTVSFWLRKGSAFSATNFLLQGISGSGTDQGILSASNGTWTNWAAPIITTISTSSITTSFTQFTATWNIPAGTNEIALYFSAFAYSGTGSANDFIDITGVQLEKGSTATSFDYRPYGTELALCQRYFALGGAGMTGWYTSATNVQGGVIFPVEMRTAPTATFLGGSIQMFSPGVGAFNGTALANQDSSTTRGIVFSITTSGATSLRLMTTPNNLVSLSSEL